MLTSAISHARKVLEAGLWLMENGYGRLAMLPYIYATGHWRCEFHPLGKPSKVLYRYSIENEHRFLASHSGGSVRKAISSKALAEAILVSVPDDLKNQCAGALRGDTREWLVELRRHLDLGRIPEAFGEHFAHPLKWTLADWLDHTQPSSMAAMPGYVMPGQEKSCLDEAYWKTAEQHITRLAKRKCVAFSSAAVLNEEVCFNIAERLRIEMAEANPFEAARLFRAAIGALHLEASSNTEDLLELSDLHVSTEPSQDPIIKRATRLLSMVHELHKAGFQRLRIASGWDVHGTVWRVRLMPAAAVAEDGWTPISETWRADYSSEDGKSFFGWQDADGDNARALAAKFIARFPGLVSRCEGADWPYAGWFAAMLGRAELGELPAFYGGGELSDEPDLPPPQLSGASERSQGTASPSYPLVPNDELRLGDLPDEQAEYEAIWPFCLSFDGYKGGLVSIDDCWAVVSKIDAQGLQSATIDELRTMAFIHQRKLKHSFDMMPVTDENPSLISIRRTIDELRLRLRPLV